MNCTFAVESRVDIGGPGAARTAPALTDTCERGIDMAERICSIDGCHKPARSRGWCSMHYLRWRRLGDPLAPVKTMGRSARDRFWEKVDKSGECWLWTAAKSVGGYGQFWPASRVRRYAHCYAYELLVGPIPEGLQIDHLCRVRLCVNPDHLEAVTQQENNRRSNSNSAINARKTHCIRGHEFTPENTYRSSKGRTCRTCHKTSLRENRAAPADSTPKGEPT